MNFDYSNLPFYSFNRFLQEKIGERIYKVSVDAPFTCPNRDGSKGVGGCTFCDSKGSSSATFEGSRRHIKEQILSNIERRSKQTAKPNKFIIYFQSFTNTYADTNYLFDLFYNAIQVHPQIAGLAISTRPDCIDLQKIEMINTFTSKLPYVSIEYGVQSIFNKTLQFYNRCETHEDFIKALSYHKMYDKLDLVAHLIIGNPFESLEELLKTAKFMNQNRVKGVKLHLLTAVKGTDLASSFENGSWIPWEKEESIKSIVDFVEALDPSCIIHRIAGHGHPDHIVAPLWLKERSQKDRLIYEIINEFNRRFTFQGNRVVH